MSRLRCWAGLLCLLLLAGCGGDRSEGPYVTNHQPSRVIAQGYARAFERTFATEVIPRLHGRACRIHMVDFVHRDATVGRPSSYEIYYVVTGAQEKMLGAGTCVPHPLVGPCLGSVGRSALEMCDPPSVPEASRAEWDDDSALSFALGGPSTVEVAVVTPDKRFVMLASADFLCQGVSREGGRLRIDPTKATGYYWNAEGRKEEVVAFAQVGAYEVLVADNLETELDGTESVMTYANAMPNEFSARGTCNPKRGE